MEGKIQNQKAKIYARLNNVDKANDFYQSSQRNLRAANAAPKQDQEENWLFNLPMQKKKFQEPCANKNAYDEDIALRDQSIDIIWSRII